MIAIIVLTIGLERLTGGHSSNALGFETTTALVASGPFVFSICCIVLGIALCICGAVDIHMSARQSRDPIVDTYSKFRKLSRFLKFILLAIFLVIMALGGAALTHLSRREIYDEATWRSLVSERPLYSCATQRRLQCAGFTVGQCTSRSLSSTSRNCPGHLCVDFCKVGTNNVVNSRICETCRSYGRAGAKAFQQCRNTEQKVGNIRGCSKGLTSELKKSYNLSLLASTLGFVWLLLATLFHSARSCLNR